MKWERADYDTDPVTLAKKLIGAVLCCCTKEGLDYGAHRGVRSLWRMLARP